MENTRAPALIKLTGEWSWKLVPHRHPKSSIPLHTPLKTETKPANLVTNRAGWAHESPTEGDALHVAEEERWKSSSGRSQVGHLGVPAWDFSFQKTSLGFRQAVWGLAGRKQKLPVLLKACRKAGTAALLPHYIGEAVRPVQNQVSRGINVSARWRAGRSVQAGRKWWQSSCPTL